MKRRKLTSFVVGDHIRLFQTDEKIYKSFNYNKHSISNVLLPSAVNLQYLMKGKTEMNITPSLSNDAIALMNTYINDNKSDVYYNIDEMEFDNSSKIIQYNNKCYFIGNSIYNANDDEKIYSLYQYNENSDFNNVLKEAISKKYDISYFDKSLTVNNKSVPVYGLGYKSLNDLSIIRLNLSSIQNIISKFNLEEISGSILYDSDAMQFSATSYNSLYIDNIIKYVEDNANKFDSEDDLKTYCENLFSEIFSNIPYDSFYRMLNPIGCLTKVGNENTNDVSQYTYSFSLDDSNFENSNFNVNYFSLKNLYNPELCHDYQLNEINQFKSVTQNSYSLSKNVIANTIKKYEEIILGKFNDYVNSNNILINTNDVISGLSSEMIDFVSEKYHRYGQTKIRELFNNEILSGWILSSDILEKPVINFFKNKFDIDIRFNEFIISSNNLYNELSKSLNEFNEYTNTLSAYNDDEIKSAITKMEFIASKTLALIVKDKMLSYQEINDVKESLNKVNELLSPGLYRCNVEPLFKNGSSGLASRVNDYMLQYVDMFNHENSFSVSGFLYGKRNYVNCNKNFMNDLLLSYNYDTSFDKTLFKSLFNNKEILNYSNGMSLERILNDNNELIILSKDNVMNLIGFDCSNVNDRITTIENYYLCKLSDNEFVLLNKDSESWKFNFFKTLDIISKYQFVDVVKGEHYYMSSTKHKSNVFSLNVKNSGLSFNYYTYDELCAEMLNKNIFNKMTISDEEFTATYPLLSYTMLYEGTDIHSAKYIKINDNDIEKSRKDILTKIKIRNTFEAAIRNSISRYAPVNTTLWKIEYSNDF